MKLSARVEIPGPLLDKQYRYLCETCGASKDFGYMGLTAESEADRHAETGNGHHVVIFERDAPALTREIIRKRLPVSRKAGMMDISSSLI